MLLFARWLLDAGAVSTRLNGSPADRSPQPGLGRLDELTPLELVRLMNAEDAKVIPAVASQAEAIARAIEVIADRLRGGGRLVYVGAGTSGRLGVLDATECPPTFNAPPGLVVGVIAGGPTALTRAVEGAEDHPEFAARDLADISLSAADVLVGIATSGRTPYVLGAVDYARGARGVHHRPVVQPGLRDSSRASIWRSRPSSARRS